MLWDNAGIAVYFFDRQNIPSDITAQAPVPANWGTPTAFWPATDCNPFQFFQNHGAIFDTTLCGDWAGAVWTDTGVPGQDQSCAQITGVATCNQFVQQNGAALSEACASASLLSFPTLPLWSAFFDNLLTLSGQIGKSRVCRSIRASNRTLSGPFKRTRSRSIHTNHTNDRTYCFYFNGIRSSTCSRICYILYNISQGLLRGGHNVGACTLFMAFKSWVDL